MKNRGHPEYMVKYKIKEWNYEKKKNDKYLLLWSNVPAWMIIDNEFFSLLGLLSDGVSIDVLTKTFRKEEEKIQSIIDNLIEMRICYKEGEKEPESIYGICKLRDIVIHPTNACNLKCIHCANRKNVVDRSKEIDVETIKKFLSETKPYTTKKCSVSIIGGEPLIVQDRIFEIAKYAKEIGYTFVGASTNGTLITKEFAKKAKELGIIMQVSIDGATPEENDYIRGKGTFEKIIKGIKILKEEEVHVTTNFTCYEGNYRSFAKYFDLALKLGVDDARFSPMKHLGNAIDEKLKSVPIDKLLNHVYKVLVKHPEYKKLLGRDYFSGFSNTCRLSKKFGYCGTGMQTVLLNSDGYVYSCTGHCFPELIAGNYNATGFKEIWENSPILKKIRNTYPVDKINDTCATCEVRYWCLGGCRAEIYSRTKNMNSPPVDCKSRKKAIYNMFWMISDSPDLVKSSYVSFD